MSQIPLRNYHKLRRTVGEKFYKIGKLLFLFTFFLAYFEEQSFLIRSCWIHSIILILSLQQLTVINRKADTTHLFLQINTTIILLGNGIIYQSGRNCQSKRCESGKSTDQRWHPSLLFSLHLGCTLVGSFLAASPLIH